MLEAVDLSDKKHTQAGALSGGMKRKLQVRHCSEQVVQDLPVVTSSAQGDMQPAQLAHMKGGMQRKLRVGQWQGQCHLVRDRSRCTSIMTSCGLHSSGIL